MYVNKKYPALRLLQEINLQIQRHGIKINDGVIVDATLVESNARPRKKVIVETEPVGDDEIPGIPTYQASELIIEESKGPNGRWVKKGLKSTHGYKSHVMVDKDHGLIQALEVTPANVHDDHMLMPLIESVDLTKETDVLADKGYCSQKNENSLAKHNREVSKERYRIERSFGSLKKYFGWDRSIYMGLKKTKDYLCMGAIAFNPKRSLKILRS